VAGWLAERETAKSSSGPAKPMSGTAKPLSNTVKSSSTSKSPTTTAKSPSTLKRLLAQAEKALEVAISKRDATSAELAAHAASASGDHARLAALSEQLASAQMAVDAAEETWIEFAAEVEARGISIED